jgi:hypothetical protein
MKSLRDAFDGLEESFMSVVLKVSLIAEIQCIKFFRILCSRLKFGTYDPETSECTIRQPPAAFGYLRVALIPGRI